MFDLKNLTLAQAEGDVAPPPSSAPYSTQSAGNGFETVPANGMPATGNNPPPKKGPIDPIMIALLLGMVVFFFVMMRNQGKEKKKRQQLLDSLKKNAKVVTAGGVIGTIIELKDNEVVLKVDESSNIKMRFTRAAIQSVISGDDND